MGIINFVQPHTASWLVDIILWLVKITSSVGLAVVLFTVLLKLVTFPFDFYSRASMRKNSLKMEEMRPELEKLQKQYANDKNLYNQKMAALYKKNGYSMWGSCLPLILTLVIFFVAIGAFNDFSKYRNVSYFYEMSQSYNEAIYEGFDEVDGYVVKDEKGRLEITDESLTAIYNLHKTEIDAGNTASESDYTSNGIPVAVKLESVTHSTDPDNPNTKFIQFSFRTTTDGKDYIYCVVNATITPAGNVDGSDKLIFGAHSFKAVINEIPNSLFYKDKVDSAKVTFDAFKAAEIDKENKKAEESGSPAVIDEQKIANDFILNVQQYRAAETFREEKDSFFWVKNIWVTDSPFKNVVNGNYKEFNSENTINISKVNYDNLTAKLSVEKSTPNGYLILVILTAASSFLTQIVTAKSQKAQMELQTVDGQGAQSQKIMKWMMPIMMAVFAFIYTAAFSIYIVLSSVISLGTTYLINFIVDRKFKKAKKNETPIRGRVYTPKEESKKEEPKKKSKKKDAIPENDFLSGLADKKGKKKK